MRGVSCIPHLSLLIKAPGIAICGFQSPGITIFLMPGLSRPERSSRLQRSRYIDAFLPKGSDQFFSNLQLLIIGIENGGAILSTFCATVNRRIMDLEKIFGEGFEVGLIGIKGNLDRFGVA